MEKIQEKAGKKLNGFLMLFILIALIVLEVYLLVAGIRTGNDQIALGFYSDDLCDHFTFQRVCGCSAE